MQLSQHSNEPLQYQDSYGVIDCLKCPAGNVKGRRRCEQAVETALYPSQPYEIALDLNELEKVRCKVFLFRWAWLLSFEM